MHKVDWAAESLWFSEMWDRMEEIEEFVQFFEGGPIKEGLIIVSAGNDTNRIRIPSDSSVCGTIMELLEARYRLLNAGLKKGESMKIEMEFDDEAFFQAVAEKAAIRLAYRERLEEYTKYVVQKAVCEPETKAAIIERVVERAAKEIQRQALPRLVEKIGGNKK